MRSVHAVYWIEDGLPQVEFFADLTEMLKCSLAKHNDPNCNFVATGSQIENCVSLGGVDAPSPDYDWRKRRK